MRAHLAGPCRSLAGGNNGVKVGIGGRLGNPSPLSKHTAAFVSNPVSERYSKQPETDGEYSGALLGERGGEMERER